MTIIQDLVQQYEDQIAIISMAGRFPGARTVEQFWENLAAGKESIKFFSQEELLKLGVDPKLVENPNFVGAEGVLEDVEYFDAEFFGYSPREAELLDPQHRIFLEVIWELLEKAGYGDGEQEQVIGVYSGAGASSYLLRNLLSHSDYVRDVGTFKVSLATGQDFVSTRASYKLGLTGPSININTLCSSSAVAVHYAREALLSYQCDIAVAGGVTISNSREDALFYQEGGIGSFDGHCRAFDYRAAGTVAGNGIALVALKRMEDAIVDGDQILGIIKGTAINNDGGDKASYTAPSPEGQARCITEAIEVSNVNPETISYIDAHGTGTNLGDPIEISGLTRAYRRFTDKSQFCGIGSVKTNIGHLVSAGGVASMIKTVMAMQHRTIPANINFDKPNPKIDFANSPFYVVSKKTPWLSEKDVLRAGVSSFGIGGTNAHIILEEAPKFLPASDKSRSNHIITLSARTATALDKMKDNLINFVRSQTQTNLADLAYTLQVGRKHFQHKFSAVAGSLNELADKLEGKDSRFVLHGVQKPFERDVCFMFPGQGSQYINMAYSTYINFPLFAQQVDQCLELISALGFDLKIELFGDAQDSQQMARLNDTLNAQLSIFVVSYAMAKLLLSWGITPSNMIGHSIGEYVAACLAGVFSLKDAIRIIVKRGELMRQMPKGSMLSVPLSVEAIQPLLGENVWHAVQNGTHNQVLSGVDEHIERIQILLQSQNINSRLLHTSHAFHSGMMEPIIEEFSQFLQQIDMYNPSMAFVSNVTGEWADEQVSTPEYWAKHLLQRVNFGTGIEKLLEFDKETLFIEVGPGKTLTSLVNAYGPLVRTASTLPTVAFAHQENETLLNAIATAWISGISVPMSKYYEGERRYRIALPTYPFEPKRYWIHPAQNETNIARQSGHKSVYSGQLDNPCTIKACTLAFNFNIGEQVSHEIKQKFLTDLNELKARFEAELKPFVSDKTSFKNSVIELVIETKTEEQHDQHQHPDSQLAAQHIRPLCAPIYVKPKSDLQKLLVKHWEEVLGYTPVGIEDNFFEVGGHSLTAAALVAKLRIQFAFEIPLVELLSAPTISMVSELIENRLWAIEQEVVTSQGEVFEL